MPFCRECANALSSVPAYTMSYLDIFQMVYGRLSRLEFSEFVRDMCIDDVVQLIRDNLDIHDPVCECIDEVLDERFPIYDTEPFDVFSSYE